MIINHVLQQEWISLRLRACHRDGPIATVRSSFRVLSHVALIDAQRTEISKEVFFGGE